MRYWEDEWQRLILGSPDPAAERGYLDRVIDAGFDGAYLDIIDGDEFFGPDGDEPERGWR